MFDDFLAYILSGQTHELNVKKFGVNYSTEKGRQLTLLESLKISTMKSLRYMEHQQQQEETEKNKQEERMASQIRGLGFND